MRYWSCVLPYDGFKMTVHFHGPRWFLDGVDFSLLGPGWEGMVEALEMHPF